MELAATSTSSSSRPRISAGDVVVHSAGVQQEQEESPAHSAPVPNACARALVWSLPRLAWVTLLIVILVWTQLVEGGIGTQASQLFGWHAWLMIMAFPVAMSEALLVFTLPLVQPSLLCHAYDQQRRCSKAMHLALHVATCLFLVGGLLGIAYFKQQSNATQSWPYFTLYTPHSWCGMTVLILFVLQFLGGVYMGSQGPTFAPQTQQTLRRWHHLLGKVVYIGGLATCAMGLQDMQSSDLSAGPDMQYAADSNFSYLSCGASLLLLFVGIIVFLVPEIQLLPYFRTHYQQGKPVE